MAERGEGERRGEEKEEEEEEEDHVVGSDCNIERERGNLYSIHIYNSFGFTQSDTHFHTVIVF